MTGNYLQYHFPAYQLLWDREFGKSIGANENMVVSKKWPGKIVTKVSPAEEFWEAEDYHQDYLVKNPNGYTCHFPRADWVI